MFNENLKPPNLRIVYKDHDIEIHVMGAWVTQKLSLWEKKLSNLTLKRPSSPFRITFDKTFSADTAGLWLLSRFFKTLEEQSDQIIFPSSLYGKRIQEYLAADSVLLPEKAVWNVYTLLENTGKKFFELWATILALGSFLGEVIITRLRLLKPGQRGVRWVSVYHHVEMVGVRAIPIIGLISFLIGAVLAYQGINQLSRFGAQIYTIDFLGIAILREIAVLITSIVVAGRTGSSYTAEIGTMALNQEIDAIRMLGLNPISVLVIPRMIALLIALPLLVFFAIIMGMVGGIVIVRLIMELSPVLLWDQFRKAVTLSTFWVGMSKAPLFAIIIALVGCFRGLQVKGSAESVGKMTTQSVVESIFLVIVCDAFMSILFSSLNL